MFQLRIPADRKAFVGPNNTRLRIRSRDFRSLVQLRMSPSCGELHCTDIRPPAHPKAYLGFFHSELEKRCGPQLAGGCCDQLADQGNTCKPNSPAGFSTPLNNSSARWGFLKSFRNGMKYGPSTHAQKTVRWWYLYHDCIQPSPLDYNQSTRVDILTEVALM